MYVYTRYVCIYGFETPFLVMHQTGLFAEESVKYGHMSLCIRYISEDEHAEDMVGDGEQHTGRLFIILLSMI